MHGVQVLSVCYTACFVVFHTRVGVAHAGLGGAGPYGGRVDGAVAKVRAVAGLAAAAGGAWAVCAKGARMLCSHLFFASVPATDMCRFRRLCNAMGELATTGHKRLLQHYLPHPAARVIRAVTGEGGRGKKKGKRGEAGGTWSPTLLYILNRHAPSSCDSPFP